MDALAWTIPPSIAVIVCALVALQYMRDQKLYATHVRMIHEHARKIQDSDISIGILDERLKQAEVSIGRLTDRSLQ